jgi:hypothetical protein
MPTHILAAATTNQIATKDAVAMAIDDVPELARSFAIPRPAAQITKPPRMMIEVRIASPSPTAGQA